MANTFQLQVIQGEHSLLQLDLRPRKMSLLLCLTYLSLSDGFLNVVVSELVSNGVPNTDTVPFEEKVIVDDRLDVAIEISGHLVVKLHGNAMHEGARLVTKSVL